MFRQFYVETTNSKLKFVKYTKALFTFKRLRFFSQSNYVVEKLNKAHLNVLRLQTTLVVNHVVGRGVHGALQTNIVSAYNIPLNVTTR